MSLQIWLPLDGNLTNLGLNLTKIEVEYSYMDQITSLSFNKDHYTFKESL